MKIYVSIVTLLICLGICGCGTSQKTITGQNKKRTSSRKAQKPDHPAAVKTYTKQIQKDSKNVKAYVDRGNAYYTLKEYAKAEQDFIKALEIDPNYSEKIHLYKATVQRLQEKHREASASYARYLETCDRKEPSCQRAATYQKQASFAADAIENPVEFKPELLSQSINNGNSQYLPHFTIDGKKMIYTERIGRQEDLFESHIKDGQFTKGMPIRGLNTSSNEGAHCISPDGKQIIFTVCDNHRTYGSCDLFGSSLTKDGWTRPKNLGKQINTDAWDSQPSLSGDGTRLYFSSKRAGGHGGSDLYVATRTGQGWGNVKNLGSGVNSNRDDESPFLHQDNRTLYFRSNGHMGMGGFDIFLARRENLNEEFANVVNIGYPINSAGDEGGLYVSLDGAKGFFASDKTYYKGDTGAKGRVNTDIYSFDIPVAAKPLPVSFLKTSVIDGSTGLATEASVKITALKQKDVYLSSTIEVGSELLVPIPVGNNYSIAVLKDGYLYHSENFSLDEGYAAAKPFEKVITLYPIPKESTAELIAESKPIILNNIFFETGSATLRPESNLEIDNLAAQLDENKNLKIKILGHTDNVGSEADNQKLSEDRAKSLFDALVQRSVSAKRLAYEGRGESQPIADNDTPEGRQKNRRTEFVIIGV